MSDKKQVTALDLIQKYEKTWDILRRYDEHKLEDVAHYSEETELASLSSEVCQKLVFA